MSKHIVTYSGKYLALDSIEEHNFDIVDIAHALSLNCRYNGHTREFYSVAQHSCLVSKFADNKMYGLLHDAHEAYTTDMPWPFKDSDPMISEIQDDIDDYLLPTFMSKITSGERDDVKTIDIKVGLTEARDLLMSTDEYKNFLAYKDGYKPYEFTINPIPPKKAEARFLNLFREYKNEY